MKATTIRAWFIACLLCISGTLFSQGISVTGTIDVNNLTVTGTIEGGAYSGTFTSGSLANITSIGTLGNLTVTNNVSAATFSGVMSTAAQPNITSLGTLGNLTVTNSIIGGSLSLTGAAAVSSLNATGSVTAVNFLPGFSTTATAAGTTTLTTNSNYIQEFTGTSTQTVTLPVVSTLDRGESFFIVNNSSGTVTVNSSGGNVVKVVPANSQVLVTCVSTSGTTAASWSQSNTYSYITGGGVGSITANSGGIAATETAIVSSVALAADRLLVGTVIRITIDGTHTATTARAPTFRVKLGTNGTTADAAIATFTFPNGTNSGTNVPFRLVIDLTVRTVGAAATLSGIAQLINNGVTGIAASAAQVLAATAATFNTTTSGNIVTATLQMSGASSTATITNAFIEFVNK
jgi:cytoskeletal protein CcmA (bactofilin family)